MNGQPSNEREPTGEVTTIYASGEVVRVSANGYAKQRPSVPPVLPDSRIDKADTGGQ